MSQSAPEQSENSLSSRYEEACPSCRLLLDLTDERLFATVKCPGCNSVFRVKTKIGTYELLEIIGHGGSSRVFRARRDQKTSEEDSLPEVALKVLEADQKDYEENLIFLRHEAKFGGLIQHPRVVKVFRLEEDADGARLEMELMEGGSLHDLMISKGTIDEQQLLEIGLEILKALAAAYAKGIVHRDLKPANILFNASGGAKLGDFGLARHLDAIGEDEPEPEIEQHLMATPDYVAPEILAGEAGDLRSDIYGLGGSLYHAFTGTSPYLTDGKSLDELRLLKLKPARLFPSKHKLRSETASLINQMLDPDPEKRFSSYADLEEAFRSTLDCLEAGQKKSPPRGGFMKRFLALVRRS